MGSEVGDQFLSLPEDAVMCVLSQLHHRDVLNVGSTCASLRRLALSDCLWMLFCRPWENHVNLKRWRAGVNSGLALFRLLSSLSKLVGHWTAQELAPRGGLLYVTWGHLSVVAYRVLVLQTGELKMQHLMDVTGLRDGSTKTKIFTSYSKPTGSIELCLPGALVWSSQDEFEIYLELVEYLEAPVLPNMENLDFLSTSEVSSHATMNDGGLIQSEELRRTRITLIESLLNASFALEQEYQLGEEDAEFVLNGHCEGQGITLSGRIAQSLYKRLIIEETNHEVDLVGLWTGLYGPHGVEIINISYTTEEIVATKVLGDPNVPCWQVTFKAKLSTESSYVQDLFQRVVDRQVDSGDRPFTIVKLYHGRGRIADTGFRDPQWIPGLLLVDQQGDIAFLWGNDYFVIPFKRLHLSSLHQKQEESRISSE